MGYFQYFKPLRVRLTTLAVDIALLVILSASAALLYMLLVSRCHSYVISGTPQGLRSSQAEALVVTRHWAY